MKIELKKEQIQPLEDKESAIKTQEIINKRPELVREIIKLDDHEAVKDLIDELDSILNKIKLFSDELSNIDNADRKKALTEKFNNEIYEDLNSLIGTPNTKEDIKDAFKLSDQSIEMYLAGLGFFKEGGHKDLATGETVEETRTKLE